MLAALAATLVPVFWSWLKHRDMQRLSPLHRAYLLTGAVIAVSLAAIVAAHALRGVVFPRDRTAIYLVMLLTFEWMLLVEMALRGPRIYRAAGLFAAIPMAIAVVFFLRGFTTSYYYEWRYDAGTRRAFEYLEEQAARQPGRFTADKPMKVGVNWKSNYTFNFYQHMYHADWMAHVERDPAPASGGFDYYVLLPEDLEPTKKLGLRVIYRDAVSSQEVAVPDPSPALASNSRGSNGTPGSRRDF
jgi:hypothetical protein